MSLSRRTFALSSIAAPTLAAAPAPGLKKIKDVMIYENDMYYCSFPSIVRRPDGELITAFRRAPNRRQIGIKGYSHTDANSYLVLVRSKDNGETWTSEPELIYAHPWGGSQDPCIVQLRDGSIVCTSYLWTLLSKTSEAPNPNVYVAGQYGFQGGFVVRSDDGARTWKGPYYPAPVPDRTVRNLFDQPLPTYNRGAMCQGRDGRLYWVIAYPRKGERAKTDVHLMISSDRGQTWKYSCPVATDATAQFNETSIYETPKGDLVAFIRTDGLNDHTVVARSRDGGKSFEPYQDAGWQGHPHHAIRLADNSVFLVYGYRHQPYGIRARILDPECTNFATAAEFTIRDDGGTRDLGYPWAVALPNRRILATYYFNHSDGLRHIAATLLSY
ncbi:MAG: exo-alpha-sialidase [Bryobacterales bacterium]|nr:exo-alpha-sialidase [Bryobacterales bacterium]